MTMTEFFLDYGPLILLAVWIVMLFLVTIALCRAAALGDQNIERQTAADEPFDFEWVDQPTPTFAETARRERARQRAERRNLTGARR